MKNVILPSLLALQFLLCLPVALQAEERTTIDRQEAANIDLQVYPGRVLAVKPVQTGNSNSPACRVKTPSADGDVHIIVIDATGGQVKSSR